MHRLVCLLMIFAATTALAPVDPLDSGVYRWADETAVATDTGERRPVLEGSTTALAYLEVHATTLEPGRAPHPSHAHADEEELVIVKEGTLRVTVGDAEQLLGPGSVGVILPGDEHGFANGGDTPATYYVFRYRSKAPMDLDRGREAGGSILVDRTALDMRASDKGGRWDYFDQPTAMFERFEMHVTRLNEGLRSHPPHTHAAEEFILIRQSDVEEQIGEAMHPATAGDLLFLDSMVQHTITNAGTGPTEYFAFQWE